MMINIAICDDSKDFVKIIEQKITHCMETKFKMQFNIKCFNNTQLFHDFLENNRVDIAFLEVMLNDINVIDWSINNLKNNYTQLIFITSFPECAYNISEAHCCYYLIKSKMTDESLCKALKRALQNTTQKEPNLTVVKVGSKNHTINYQDIIFIETFNNNLVLTIKNQKKITIYSSLKEYTKKLPPNFLRCHKSYMVNMNHIVGYEPHKFRVISGHEIPIPPKKYKEIINIYKNYIYNL